jgi:hypothetical protein
MRFTGWNNASTTVEGLANLAWMDDTVDMQIFKGQDHVIVKRKNSTGMHTVSYTR